jgi:hypothetical protein
MRDADGGSAFTSYRPVVRRHIDLQRVCSALCRGAYTA